VLRRGGATLTDDYRMTICVHASVHLLSTLGVPCVACSFIVIWRKDAVATLWRSSCVGGLPRGFTHSWPEYDQRARPRGVSPRNCPSGRFFERTALIRQRDRDWALSTMAVQQCSRCELTRSRIGMQSPIQYHIAECQPGETRCVRGASVLV